MIAGPTMEELGESLRSELARSKLGNGRIGSITPLVPHGAVPEGVTVADGVTKLLACDVAGRPLAVVLCASPVAPGLVARGMQRAREAKAILGAELGRVILDPLAEGEVLGLSFAALPHCRSLGESRLVWYWQRRALRPVVFEWLRRATEKTLHQPGADELDGSFGAPLRHLSKLAAMPDDVRRAATTALDRLERGVWRPKHVLMHNDLWEGNILIDDANITDRAGRPWTERFVVIDWPGAVLKGYAIYDLIRLSRGMALSGRRLREEIEAHGRILGCDVEDAGSHLLAALGFLGTHLEHFPPEAYRRTTITCLGILGRIGRGGDGPGLTERMASTPPGVAATIAHGEPAVGRPE